MPGIKQLTIFSTINIFTTTESYKINLDSESAKTFLRASRNTRIANTEDTPLSINEELRESCVEQPCTLDEHNNLEFWEEQFEPARTHAHEKVEEKSELSESHAEFSEIESDFTVEMRESLFESMLEEVVSKRNSSWTRLRNNCAFDGGCYEVGTASCVQKWNSRVCACKEGYYGVDCEKGGDCLKKYGDEVKEAEPGFDDVVGVTSSDEVTSSVEVTSSAELTSSVEVTSSAEVTSNTKKVTSKGKTEFPDWSKVT